MTSESLNAQQVADFLSQNPDFFSTHADVFHEMEVAHPTDDKTISLAQRQLLGLRKKTKQLESQLKELSIYALQNQDIGATVTDWCVALLAEKDATQLPEVACHYLREAFPELQVALRLWGDVDAPDFVYDNPEFHEQIAEMDRAYVGSSYPEEVAQWFDEAPASAVVLPLRDMEKNFGVLVFASDDENHFTEDMEQSFLIMISALSSAAMSRLYSDDTEEAA